MKPRKNRIVWFLRTGLLIGTAQLTLADTKENPYSAIVERNAFGLRPPPPPPVETPPTLNTPQVTVELTGITSILSKRKALLEITEPGPGKTPKKPIMEEGDRIDAIEVISIDVEKGQVRIRNSGVESNLSFKVAKSLPVPGTPGAPPPVLGTLPAPPVFPGNPASAGPTIISPNSAGAGYDRSGVTIVGGGAPAATGPAVAAATVGGATPTTAFFGATASTTLGSTVPGLKTIPSRQIRTEPAVASLFQPKPLSREELDIQMEVLREMNRGKGFPPLPPTHLNPTGE